jgi:hypothetical protein
MFFAQFASYLITLANSNFSLLSSLEQESNLMMSLRHVCVCVCMCVLSLSLSNLKQPTDFHHLEYRFNAITNDPSVCNFQFPAIGNTKTEDTRNYEVGVVFKNMKIC